MATKAADRLNPPKKQNNGDSNLALQVRPVIKMGAPKIDIPEVKIPPINVAASDMRPIAEAVAQLGAAIAQVANAQTQILQAIGQQNDILRQLAEKNPDINVPAPVVKMAQRPRNFRVELEKEDGETVAMDITASPS